MDITSDKIGLNTDEHIDVINLKVRKEFIGPLRKKKDFIVLITWINLIGLRLI